MRTQDAALFPKIMNRPTIQSESIMSGCMPQYLLPVSIGWMAAAIREDAISPIRKFKSQRGGMMGAIIRSLRDNSCIKNQQTTSDQGTFKATVF